MASRAASSSARSASSSSQSPTMTTWTAIAVVGLDLALQQADALGQHGGVLTDGARRAALEEPGPQLALLGPGEAHHVLRDRRTTAG